MSCCPPASRHHEEQIWLQNNPSAVDRFQKAIVGELQAVAHHGG